MKLRNYSVFKTPSKLSISEIFQIIWNTACGLGTGGSSLIFQCRVAPPPVMFVQVPSTATEKEINTAYKRLALKYHPDRTRGDEEAAEKFKEIAAAYAVR